MQNIKLQFKKIKCSASLKRSGHVDSKIENLEEIYRSYFHAKSKFKSKKYDKVKFHTSLKSCGHAESKILDCKQFW